MVKKKSINKKIKNAQKSHSRKGTKHKEKSFKIAFFLTKFFTIFLILTTIVQLLDLSFFTEWLATITAMPFGVQAIGSAITINGQEFLVSNACTGLMSASILAAVIFSLKKPEMGKKAVIFLVGLFILLLANIPRIMLVLWSATIGLDAGLIHTLTWFLMSALILILWYFGTEKVAGIKDFSNLL